MRASRLDGHPSVATALCQQAHDAAAAEERQNIFRRHRRGKVEALCLSASPPVQQSHLVRRFHAFGDDSNSQFSREADRRLDDCRVVGIDANILDEFLRDFDPIHRETPKVEQRGIARAKVVDRDFQPAGA